MRWETLLHPCLGLSKWPCFYAARFVDRQVYSGQSYLRDVWSHLEREPQLFNYILSVKPKKWESIISQSPSFVKVLRWLNVAEHHQFPGRIVCWIQCIFVSLELLKKSGWDIECGATLSTLQSFPTSQHLRTWEYLKLKLTRKTNFMWVGCGWHSELIRLIFNSAIIWQRRSNFSDTASILDDFKSSNE